MEKSEEKNLFPTKFKLVSFYEEEWKKSKKELLNLKDECENKDISLEDKFKKLSNIIQKFENQNGDEDYEDCSFQDNCFNLQAAIKLYFANKEEDFYKNLLPFIIDQSLLL